MKVYLSKAQLEDIANEEETVTYIALKMMYDKMLTQDKTEIQVYVNAQSLYSELSGSLNVSRSTKDKLNKGLKSLCEQGIVDLIAEDNHGNYIIDIVKLTINIKHEAYTVISREEIRNIFNIKKNSPMSLLYFAVNVFGTINYTHKCGYCSLDTLRQLSNLGSKNTCVSMMKLLEENNILYIRHSENAKRNTNGEIKNLPSCYGRYKDKEQIDQFYTSKCLKEGYDFTQTMSSFRKSKLTKNYNKYINGDYKEDIINLIRECLAFNKLPYNEQHPENKKNLSVFDQELIKEAELSLNEHIKHEKEQEKKIKKLKEKSNNIKWLNALDIGEIRNTNSNYTKLKNNDFLNDDLLNDEYDEDNLF